MIDNDSRTRAYVGWAFAPIAVVLVMLMRDVSGWLLIGIATLTVMPKRIVSRVVPPPILSGLIIGVAFATFSLAAEDQSIGPFGDTVWATLMVGWIGVVVTARMVEARISR
jgi:hypothetical protein